MLWGHETVSETVYVLHDQVPSSRIVLKAVVQAHETAFLRIGTTTPSDQSIATAPVTLRKQLAKRQGDASSHGVGRKNG